jgi:hypothetical protein
MTRPCQCVGECLGAIRVRSGEHCQMTGERHLYLTGQQIPKPVLSAEIVAAKDRYDRVNDGETLLDVYPHMGVIEACNACCADERLLFNAGVIPFSTCGVG